MKNTNVFDFSNQDLRGKSFKNQNLAGADFSGADIRGVNFKNATLTNANFQYAIGGIRLKNKLMLFLISMLFGFFSTALSAFSGSILMESMREWDKQYSFIVSHYFYYILLLSVILLIISFAIMSKIKNKIIEYIIGAFIVMWLIAFFYTLLRAFIITGIFAVVVAIVFLEAGSAAYTGAFVGSTVAAALVSIAFSNPSSILFTLLLYCSLLEIRKDEDFEYLRKYGLFWGAIGGTKFYGTDLSDSNFRNTRLRGCCFNKKTKLDRVCFKNAIDIRYTYAKGTLLENSLVRELLNTGNGSRDNFSGLYMKGAYIEGANLIDANLSEADLSGAILKNSILKNANLSKTQCMGTDFSGADFTGTCLESWNIDTTTCLHGAYAEYVYLLSNQQERRPNSGIFLDIEFCKLFQEILNTVDFIFKKGINWQAFMISFDQFRERIRIQSDSECELSVQSIENKGDGVFVIKVNVPPDINKEKIHKAFSKYYDEQLKLIEAQYQAKLKMKDYEIAIYRKHNTDLIQIINTLASRPMKTLQYVR